MSENINQKIKQLDQLVEWFYSDQFKLEEATTKYKKAIELAKKIESDLNSMKNEVEVLAKDFTE